jgi:hypothetical protein
MPFGVRSLCRAHRSGNATKPHQIKEATNHRFLQPAPGFMLVATPRWGSRRSRLAARTPSKPVRLAAGVGTAGARPSAPRELWPPTNSPVGETSRHQARGTHLGRAHPNGPGRMVDATSGAADSAAPLVFLAPPWPLRWRGHTPRRDRRSDQPHRSVLPISFDHKALRVLAGLRSLVTYASTVPLPGAAKKDVILTQREQRAQRPGRGSSVPYVPTG